MRFFNWDFIRANFKPFLFLFGIALIISSLLYSQRLVKKLQNKTTEYVRFRIKFLEQSLNNPNVNVDINFLFNEVIQSADYPLIYTDIQHRPQSWRNISPQIDQKPIEEFSHEDSVTLFSALKNIEKENPPIPIKYQNDITLGYYYYGYPPEIYQLRIFPYLAIFATAVFVLVGYIGFSYIKRNEQRSIWIGMAKETAHQLGTPLTSLSGWIELLQLQPNALPKVIKEIENDVNRLKKIATRFSQIGSRPELVQTEIEPLIDGVLEYFRKRLPQMQKKMVLQTNYQHKGKKVYINRDLFEWVLENLVKNAIDAIRSKSQGRILISTDYNEDRAEFYLDIIDNGKGIAVQDRTKIFKPGFSTKKRGWGLGLSLARRIIENYHGGKLILKESKPNSGSVFRIVLRIRGMGDLT